MEKLDCNLETLGYILGLLGYTVEKKGYIQVKQEMMVPNLDLLVHIEDLRVNVQVIAHALEKVHKLTLQESLVTQAEDSKQVSILAIIHLHHCLKVKSQVLQVSCHFPFQVTMVLPHMLV